ncbi:MAG: hypothetical protein K8T89_09605 [Planctomycetes bacterium]|nr:hypothetical protein [Planctomycetota bacterium]
MRPGLLTMVLMGLVMIAGTASAGHTRAAYVDGCQSVDGRFVVTARYVPSESKAKSYGEWEFTWKDTKLDKTLTGKLQGIMGVGHFDVTYAHIFVAPDGETFAVWNGGSFASPAPNGEAKDDLRKLADHSAFADRLIVYRKNGEIVKRVGLKDILLPKEWVYVYWVHGNLYWSIEYPDAVKNGGEAPRAGMRYFRVSPDYTVLEVTVGACGDARHKLKDMEDAVLNHHRIVRFDLTTGQVIDPQAKPADESKVPVRPFAGNLITRAESQYYLPALDPIREAGKVDESLKRDKK